MAQHDSVMSAHCFIDKNKPWCYGETVIIICGLITLTFSIWCLYRMFKYQNEAKSAVRSFIIYLSILLSILSILHGLFLDGSSMSLTSSFLVSVQCSLFTVFFIKICIRTNSDTLSISMDCERVFQITFLFIMVSIEICFFLWSLITFKENEIDCHSPAFMAFSCIDVAQILCTIIAVCFIQRKINKQHQRVTYNQYQSALIIPNENSPSLQPLSVVKNIDLKLKLENQQIGQIQMLQKSHQLLLLVVFIFLCAIITAVYETWLLTIPDCSTFIQNNEVINEIFRLIARITWLFIPSWLVIYVFWIWPIRPKKYVSDDSLRRIEIQRQESEQRRHRILNKICCYCFIKNNNNNAYGVEVDMHDNQNQYNHYNVIEDIITPEQERKNSNSYRYDSDNRIISEIDDKIININQNSLAPYPTNDHQMYQNISDDCNNDDSSSSLGSDSMRRSDIWDQHVTTENIRSPPAKT